MTNRFEKKSKILNISDTAYRILSAVIFAAIILLFYFAVDASGKNTIEKQQESLESASSGSDIS